MKKVSIKRRRRGAESLPAAELTITRLVRALSAAPNYIHAFTDAEYEAWFKNERDRALELARAYKRSQTCPECDGTGEFPTQHAWSKRVCSTCKGTGRTTP